MLLKEIKFPVRSVEKDSELGIDAGKYVGVHFTPETIEAVKKVINSEKIPNPTNPDDRDWET